MKPTRVLVAGNSVSLRSSVGALAYPQYLEAELGPEWTVLSVIRGGATVGEFEDEILQAIETSRPAALVLQVGINECAPRPLGRRGRARLSRLRPVWLRERIIGVLHRYRPEIIRLRGVRQFMSPPEFAAAVNRVIDQALRRGCAVLILPITRIPSPAEARTPFTNREVVRYNGLLGAHHGGAVRFVAEAELFNGQTPEEYCAGPETVHLNASAHQRIARVVADWIRSLESAHSVQAHDVAR